MSVIRKERASEVGDETGAVVHPLLKWAGGKRALAPEIAPLLKGYRRYFEPFFGGGAMFFNLDPQNAVLSDLNSELINCYKVTKSQPDELIKKLRKLKNSAEEYYRIRTSSPRSDAGRAARFIYLCTLSFNGLYRVNEAGQFNVPYGHKEHLNPCDALLIRAVSQRLKNCKIRCCDFEKSVAKASPGDCVYFDPPYTVAHGNNGFIKYNEKIFSWKDQERLEAVARGLANKGVRVVISNADHPSLRKLYKAFHVRTIKRWSVISGRSEGRKAITECLFFLGGNDD